MFNPTIANCQANGATIIDRCLIDETWIWLCDFKGHTMPYVTWISSKDNPGETVWGHYFEMYNAAFEDFQERIQQQWGMQ